MTSGKDSNQVYVPCVRAITFTKRPGGVSWPSFFPFLGQERMLVSSESKS